MIMLPGVKESDVQVSGFKAEVSAEILGREAELMGVA